MFQSLTSIFLILISIFSVFIQESYANVSSAQYSVNAINIDNFYKVDNDYYRGAQPDIDDDISLARLGIKTIINLRELHRFNKAGLQKQKYAAKLLGMNYINIPMNPKYPPTKEQINYFFSIVNNRNNLPVYVHCAQGRDRTGIMTALYRVKKYSWNFNQAYYEMKQKGYHCLLFPKQKSFLSEYTNNLLN